MKQVEERYISLLTDFGFDRLIEEAEIARVRDQQDGISRHQEFRRHR